MWEPKREDPTSIGGCMEACELVRRMNFIYVICIKGQNLTNKVEIVQNTLHFWVEIQLCWWSQLGGDAKYRGS